MKKFMKLIPALAMLLIATTLVSTATFAWFSMNNTVEAVNMQVKARAEQGLLINEVADASDDEWDNQATAALEPGTALVPTSTTNAAKWFHANSKKASDEAGAGVNTKDGNLSGNYEELTGLTAAKTDAVAGSQAEVNVYYKNNDGAAGYTEGKDTAYYVMYKYYLKVSNGEGISDLGKDANDQNVAITSVTATLPDTPNSADLDKALRVGVKMGGRMYIYAPVYATDATIATYNVVTSATTTAGVQTITTAAVAPLKSNRQALTALTELPGITGDSTDNEGEEVDIYIWFEGEDENCKSANLAEATLDDIKVNVTFSLVNVATTQDPAIIANNEFAIS